MSKKKAFTFVELLLVMMVLGVIISLTLPIIKNLKDNDSIYRAYMKKANQDITDAISMIYFKYRGFRGFSAMGSYTTGNLTADDEGLRNAFNYGLNTFLCKDCAGDRCVTNDDCLDTTYNDINDNNIKGNVGLNLGGKSVMLFQWLGDTAFDDPDLEHIYGYVYFDMNGDKAPNEMCKDRYRFMLYNDRAAMDGCSFSM